MKHNYGETRAATFAGVLKAADGYYAMLQIKMPWHIGSSRHQWSDLYQAGRNY